jgi:hypothetical protein
MNTLKAISLITIGGFSIIYAYRNPNKTFPAHTVGGYMGGIGFIVLAFLILFDKINL